MAYGDYYDTQEFDFLLGTTKQAVEDIQLAIADASSLSTSGGATTQVVGFDSGGNPIPINVQGDSNGAGLSVSSGILTATLTQDLRTSASPTFADISITDDLSVTNDATVGTLAIGGGDIIKKIEAGTVASVDPGSIAAQTRGSVDIAITGVATGDIVTLNPPDGLNTGLAYAGCRVTGADTVRVYLANITGGAIDDGALTWDYLWYDLT